MTRRDPAREAALRYYYSISYMKTRGASFSHWRKTIGSLKKKEFDALTRAIRRHARREVEEALERATPTFAELEGWIHERMCSCEKAALSVGATADLVADEIANRLEQKRLAAIRARGGRRKK